MKIVQVSDIHIRPVSRHAEYKKAFELLFSRLREMKPDLIVNTGDLIHNKTIVSAELFSMLSWFFKECVKIAPMINILGNHDANLTNDQREDVITSVIDAIELENCFVYKNSGIYYHNMNDLKIAFTVFSLFDKKKWPELKPDKSTEIDVNIALFHGTVAKSITDLNWMMKHGEEYGNRHVTLDFFKGYDFVMLGDIHKQQFLDFREVEEKILTEQELEELKKQKNLQIEIVNEIDE